jgi:two-component sensor histidine kinase
MFVANKIYMISLSKKCTLLLLSCFLLQTVSCSNKKENPVYEQPKPIKRDATFTWIDEASNADKPNYMAVFYPYYHQLIKENKWEDAADVLNAACRNNSRINSFDNTFITTINTFVRQYRAKLPVAKTLFINSYFSDFYKNKGNYKSAIFYALKSIKAKVTDYTTCKDVADAYSDLAFCYYKIGNQNAAISNNFKALDLNNRINNDIGSARIYNTLATIYFVSNDFASAERYCDLAIKYSKKANDIDNVFITLENKIIVYEETNNPKINALIDSTYVAFNESKIQSDDVKVFVYCYYIIKLCKENKLKEAKQIIDALEPIVRQTNSLDANVEFDEVVMEYKLKNNEKIDTEKLINEVIPYLIENEDYNRLDTYYNLLKVNAIKIKDYKVALFYEEKANEAFTMLGNSRNSNKVIELDKKYQTQKKEQQIATQEKVIANKNATIAWMTFLLLVVVIVVVIYQNKQQKKKLRLDQLNAQRYTKQLLEKTEEERIRIARDLHDSVSHELLGLKNVADGKQAETNEKIDRIINDIRSISRNLHPIMFDKIGLKASVEQLIERTQVVNNFMVSAEIEYHGLLSNSDELQVYRIIQEALSNVIKYSDAIAAKISIFEKDKAVYIEIQDNGKGFNFTETINSSKSFGLHNIIERSRAIGGEAKIKSNKNGTTVAIEIKKK